MKMTEEQVIKALEDWLNSMREDQQRCLEIGCPSDAIEETHGTYIDILVNALKIIKAKGGEIETCYNHIKQLKDARNLWEDKCKEKQAEIERMQEIIIMGKFTSPIAIRAQQSWHRQNRENINRLNEEIERLKRNIEALAICKKDLPQKTTNAIIAESVNEFAEKFLKKVHDNHYVLEDAINSKDHGMFTVGIEQAVNETKKEMVGKG